MSYDRFDTGLIRCLECLKPKVKPPRQSSGYFQIRANPITPMLQQLRALHLAQPRLFHQQMPTKYVFTLRYSWSPHAAIAGTVGMPIRRYGLVLLLGPRLAFRMRPAVACSTSLVRQCEAALEKLQRVILSSEGFVPTDFVLLFDNISRVSSDQLLLTALPWNGMLSETWRVCLRVYTADNFDFFRMRHVIFESWGSLSPFTCMMWKIITHPTSLFVCADNDKQSSVDSLQQQSVGLAAA